MVCYIKGGMQGKDIWKQILEVNIWAQEGYESGVKRLYNEGLHSLWRSPNIVKVIKSRRLRLAGHVAIMEEGKAAYKILKKYT